MWSIVYRDKRGEEKGNLVKGKFPIKNKMLLRMESLIHGVLPIGTVSKTIKTFVETSMTTMRGLS